MYISCTWVPEVLKDYVFNQLSNWKSYRAKAKTPVAVTATGSVIYSWKIHRTTTNGPWAGFHTARSQKWWLLDKSRRTTWEQQERQLLKPGFPLSFAQNRSDILTISAKHNCSGTPWVMLWCWASTPGKVFLLAIFLAFPFDLHATSCEFSFNFVTYCFVKMPEEPPHTLRINVSGICASFS